MDNLNLELDEAFGIIPIRQINFEWQALIVKSKHGNWGFPKGHAEAGETAIETAERELQEETGLLVKSYYPLEPISANYICMSHGKEVNKTVTFFIADTEGVISLCPKEIVECAWVNLDELNQKITFDNMQLLLEELRSYFA